MSMSIVRPGTDDDPLRLECVICDAETPLDNTVLECIAPDESLRETDDWYLHIHDLNDDLSLDVADTYGFCPEHLPETPFPTADTAPETFEMEAAIAELRAEFDAATD